LLPLKLSIIIVNYNVKYFLEQCLYSVQKGIEGLEAEVIVVDNASTDGSIKYLQPQFPFVQFIICKANNGFARACNQGLKVAKGAFILFLNPDTIVAEDSFHTCIHFFNANTNCGAIGVRMIDGSGIFLKESKRAFPAPLTSFYKLAGLASVFPHSKLFARYHLGHLNNDEDHEVDVLAGAFMMIRKEVLDTVGSFDEAFFMYGEDIDLSYRIQKAGYKNYYLAKTTIIHFKGESTSRESLKYVKLFYKAMLIFVQKHYTGSTAILFRLIIQLGIWLRGFITAFTKGIKRIGKSFSMAAQNKELPINPSRLLIVASDAELPGVKTLIQSGLPFVIAETTPSINLIDTTLKESTANKILYVSGALSYKTIIADLPLHKSCKKLFHAYKSRSIICSEISTTNGEVYTSHYKKEEELKNPTFKQQ
jgi:GT2 family glycosyltransferase